MNLNILAAIASNFPKKRDYTLTFFSFSGYLLSGMVLVLGILWIKSQEIDVKRHDRYLANLRQMQTLDARINQSDFKDNLCRGSFKQRQTVVF
jgi:heme exporter protein D